MAIAFKSYLSALDNRPLVIREHYYPRLVMKITFNMAQTVNHTSPMQPRIERNGSALIRKHGVMAVSEINR